MRSTIDIAWLGGLLEGEAAFTDSPRKSVMIQLQMTDGDVIARAASILGVKTRKPWLRKDGYKPVHSCYVCGRDAIGWMMTVYQFLGERRQQRIREIIERWSASKRMSKCRVGKKVMALCHPDRPVTGNMLCRPCWMREYRKRTGKNGSYYRKLAAEAPA